jgi:hypothetical protein
MDSSDLFSNGKSGGPGDMAQAHDGPRQRGQKGATAPYRRVGARARWCSLAAAEEDGSG